MRSVIMTGNADMIPEGADVYRVEPPHTTIGEDGTIESVIAAYDTEIGGEKLTMPVGKIVVESYDQKLALAYVRQTAIANTVKVMGLASNQTVFAEFNPVMRQGKNIDPKSHTPHQIAKNLLQLQREAATSVFAFLGIEEPAETLSDRLQRKWNERRVKAVVPTIRTVKN